MGSGTVRDDPPTVLESTETVQPSVRYTLPGPEVQLLLRCGPRELPSDLSRSLLFKLAAVRAHCPHKDKTRINQALAQCGFPYGLGKTTKTSPHPPVDLKSALRTAVTGMIGPARSMIDACVMLLDPMPRTGPRHQGTALQACLKLISAILGEDMQPDSAAKFLLRPSGAPIAVTSPAGVRRLQAKVEDVAAAVTGSPQRKRKRGRPKGSKNKKKRLGPTAPDVVAHAGTPSTDVVSSVEDMMELDVEEETEAMETRSLAAGDYGHGRHAVVYQGGQLEARRYQGSC